MWEFEGERYTQVGMNAVAGRRPETYGLEPFRFDQMRPGCYDVDARVRDMDINGVWASVNFPSQITGFCGRVFFACPDRELGLGCVRAWNDWLFEEWYQRHPDRIVPLGITYLSDPELAAEEIRRNAERGFTSVTFPERPHEIGLPSLWERDALGSDHARPPSRRTPWYRCTSAARASRSDRRVVHPSRSAPPCSASDL